MSPVVGDRLGVATPARRLILAGIATLLSWSFPCTTCTATPATAEDDSCAVSAPGASRGGLVGGLVLALGLVAIAAARRRR